MRLLIVIILLSITSADAQWLIDKKFWAPATANGREIFLMPDGGFLLQGGVETPWSHCYLIRTDMNGDTVWTKTFGTDSIQYLTYDMTSTPDGGFIINGEYQTVLTNGSMDSYVQKIDSLGNTVWFNMYGQPWTNAGGKDHGEIVKMIGDSILIALSIAKNYFWTADSFCCPVGGWWENLAKFNAVTGDLEKQFSIRTQSLQTSFRALDMESIHDRIFVLGEELTSTGTVSYFTTVLYVYNSDLDSLYRLDSLSYHFTGLSKTNNNELLLFGDSLIAKMDTSGNFIFTAPNQLEGVPTEMKETQDGHLVSIGGSYYFGLFETRQNNFGNADIYLNKFTANGNVVWSRHLLPQLHGTRNLLYNVVETKDNDFAFIGYSQQFIWFTKTDSSGNVIASTEYFTADQNSVYPNPSSGIFNLQLESVPDRVLIYDITGKFITEQNPTDKNFNVDLSNYNAGCYICSIMTEEKISIIKLFKNE